MKFAGWWARLLDSLRRSGRSLLLVVFVTHILPQLLLAVFPIIYLSMFLSSPAFGPDADTLTPAQADAEAAELAGRLPVLIAFVLVAVIVSLLLQSLGYGAATWTMVREAAGQPAGLGDALRYGARRMLGLSGWTLVFGLAVAVGACFCVLPGVYLGAVLCLFGPVYLFERQNPLGSAWRLFHDNFSQVLGRVALIAGLIFGVEMAISVVEQVAIGVLGLDPGINVVTVGGMIVSVLVSLAATVFQTVGLVLTYAEQRAVHGPVSTPVLLAELAWPVR